MIRPRSVGVIRFAGLGRRGADHENDDEGAAFCGAQIGASDQGAVRSGDGGGECSTGTGGGNRSAMCGAAYADPYCITQTPLGEVESVRVVNAPAAPA